MRRQMQQVVVEAIQYLPGEGCRAVYEFLGWNFATHVEETCGQEADLFLDDSWVTPAVSPGQWIIKNPLPSAPPYFVMDTYPVLGEIGEVVTVEEILTVIEPTSEDVEAIFDLSGYQAGFVDGLRGAQARIREHVHG